MKGGGSCTPQLKKKMHCTATLKEGGKKAPKSKKNNLAEYNKK